jgi:glutathione reductase (NADPH)
VIYDVLVMGAGSGGLAAAKTAAASGAHTAIAEANQLGGTCVNRGCIPKKLLVQAAEFVYQQQVAASFEWVNPQGLLDWPALKAAIGEHLKSLRHTQQQTLQNAGIEILRGTAHFIDEHRVMVDDQVVEARHIIIAVGGSPTLPDIPGKDLAVTSRGMFELPDIPEQLAIVGAGYIGVEFSHIFGLLGAKVTLIDTDERVLDGFDMDLRSVVQSGLERLGIRFIPKTTGKAIEARDSQRLLSLAGETSETITADTVLMAVGRSPNLAALKLEQAGVAVKDGTLVVDAYGQTSCPTIYAVGDCVGRLPLTPVAIAEGNAVAHTICQQHPTTVDYRWIPSAVFGMPPVATVGWTEAEAQDHLGHDLRTIRQRFTPLSHRLMESPPEFLTKWIVQSSTEQVVGAHFAGHQAPEVLQGLLPALKRGMTVSELANTIGIHPTLGEELFTIVTDD